MHILLVELFDVKRMKRRILNGVPDSSGTLVPLADQQISIQWKFSTHTPELADERK